MMSRKLWELLLATVLAALVAVLGTGLLLNNPGWVTPALQALTAWDPAHLAALLNLFGAPVGVVVYRRLVREEMRRELAPLVARVAKAEERIGLLDQVATGYRSRLVELEHAAYANARGSR